MGATNLFAADDSNRTLTLDRPLKFLSCREIQQIDETLASLGAFGEVRLIKERGKLRFIQKLESEKMQGPSSPSRTGH
jgi:hypothetical protein